MDGWHTGEGTGHDLRPPLSPRAPISHKRFLVELKPEERTYLKQLTASGSPQTLPRRRAQIWLLCDQAGGAGLDRRAHGGGRGRDRHDRVPGAPSPGPGGGRGGPAAQAAAAQLDGVAQAELACSTPPPGRTRWILKLLCRELAALEVVD